MSSVRRPLKVVKKVTLQVIFLNLLLQGKDSKKKKLIVEEEGSEALEDDADLLNMDQHNQLGGLDQEQLTAEEKEEQIFKTLTTNNPQAPHNLTKFSYKDRHFRTDDLVEQMVIHFSFDGDVLLKDSDEARDQEEFWDNKKRTN